jgi:RimJ/RimL family protein N-acetyltransferase
VISAGWLQLRPWAPALRPRVLEALTDPDVVRWSPQRGPVDLGGAAGWIEQQNAAWLEGTKYCLAVHDAGSGELLGDVTIANLDTFTATAWIGYWTAPWARGRGVASSALVAMTRWAFSAVGFHRLQLSHAVENTASCRVAEKSGYRAEGILLSSLPKPEGGWWDTELHAMVNPAG